MASAGTVRAGFLNVVATPHPPGVYERLFRGAAFHPVQFWGESRAAISNIRQRPGETDLFSGRLLLWTEIDPSAPAVDKAKLEQVPLDQTLKNMTKSVGFNLKVFMFVLDTSKHRVTFQSTNEFQQNLSPRRAETIFSLLLSPEVLGLDAEEVEVTFEPEDDALSKVLGISRLDKIEILIKRPNPDDLSPEATSVLKELQDQNARNQLTTLSRAAKTDGLKLNERNTLLARVGASNGHVKAVGRNAEGEHDERSTKQYPKAIERIVEQGASILSAITGIAKSTRPNS